VGIGTLYMLAKEGGYKPGKNGDYTPIEAPVRPPIVMPDESPVVAIQKREIAQKFWNESIQKIPHDYATGKGFPKHGLRVNGKWLVVPAYNADREIQSVQRINGKDKFNLAGTHISGCYYPIKGDKSTIVVCEGWSTGMSINAGTGYAVAVAFGKGNLKRIAKMMHDKLPDSRLIVAADSDHIAIAQEAAMAASGLVAIPQ
jgi:phage/plasmid primase-like uncharacterized protein